MLTARLGMKVFCPKLSQRACDRVHLAHPNQSLAKGRSCRRILTVRGTEACQFERTASKVPAGTLIRARPARSIALELRLSIFHGAPTSREEHGRSCSVWAPRTFTMQSSLWTTPIVRTTSCEPSGAVVASTMLPRLRRLGLIDFQIASTTQRMPAFLSRDAVTPASSRDKNGPTLTRIRWPVGV